MSKSNTYECFFSVSLPFVLPASNECFFSARHLPKAIKSACGANIMSKALAFGYLKYSTHIPPP